MSATAKRLKDFGPYMQFELVAGDVKGTLYTKSEDIEIAVRDAFYDLVEFRGGFKH